MSLDTTNEVEQPNYQEVRVVFQSSDGSQYEISSEIDPALLDEMYTIKMQPTVNIQQSSQEDEFSRRPNTPLIQPPVVKNSRCKRCKRVAQVIVLTIIISLVLGLVAQYMTYSPYYTHTVLSIAVNGTLILTFEYIQEDHLTNLDHGGVTRRLAINGLIYDCCLPRDQYGVYLSDVYCCSDIGIVRFDVINDDVDNYLSLQCKRISCYRAMNRTQLWIVDDNGATLIRT